jgi:hypothetical protein
MNVMPVALYGDRVKAEALQRRLVDAGFNALLNDKPPLTNLWFVSREKSNVRVEVPEDQFGRAENFLLAMDSTDAVLKGAVRCPECGSLRVQYPQFAQHSLLTNVAMGMLAQLHAIEKDYYCEDCHFEWPKDGYRTRRNRPHSAPFYFIEGIEQTRLESEEPHIDDHRKAA